MMKAKWKKFDSHCQELMVTSWIEANVFDPSIYTYGENPGDWGWDIWVEGKTLGEGRAKTERSAKRAAERELIKLFRQLGKALDYDVE